MIIFRNISQSVPARIALGKIICERPLVKINTSMLKRTIILVPVIGKLETKFVYLNEMVFFGYVWQKNKCKVRVNKKYKCVYGLFYSKII